VPVSKTDRRNEYVAFARARNTTTATSIIPTVDQLHAIYAAPNEASTVKVSAMITPPYRTLIDQCARAIVRSDLRNPDKRVDPKTLPTPGQILADMSENRVGGEDYDRARPERAR